MTSSLIFLNHGFYREKSPLPSNYWVSPSKALIEMNIRQSEGIGKDMTKDIDDSDKLIKTKVSEDFFLVLPVLSSSVVSVNINNFLKKAAYTIECTGSLLLFNVLDWM